MINYISPSFCLNFHAHYPAPSAPLLSTYTPPANQINHPSFLQLLPAPRAMDSREKALVGGDEVPGFLAAAVRGEVVAAADEAPVVGPPTGLDGAGLLVLGG